MSLANLAIRFWWPQPLLKGSYPDLSNSSDIGSMVWTNRCHLSTTLLFEFGEYDPCWKGAMTVFQRWRRYDEGMSGLQINLNSIGVSYWSCYWKGVITLFQGLMILTWWRHLPISKQSELNCCFLQVIQSKCNEHNPCWIGVITIYQSHLILHWLLHHLTWS